MKSDFTPDLAALPPLSLDGVLIDFPRLLVQRAETTIRLSTTEWALLVLLARHPNQVLSYYRIICSLWGESRWDQYQVKSLSGHVCTLRRKIEPEPSRPRYLRTSIGIGYYLEAPAGWCPRSLSRADLRLVSGEVQRPALATELTSAPVREVVRVLVDALTAWLAAQEAPPALAERQIGGVR